MKDFITKIDDNATSAGVVVADEYNSIFNEAKNVITPFIALDDADSKQMQKAIDIASKATFYTDTGTANSVVLSRGATAETTETLFDGMVVIFAPANTNTGATTLKIKTLDAKPLYFDGAVLTAGFLAIDSKYIAIYDVASGRFNVDLLASYKNIIGKVPQTGIQNTDDWNGETYIDAFAEGANPTAKIYPNGLIVGSTDNGQYKRYPDGTFEITILKAATHTISTVTGTLYSGVFTFPLPLTILTVESAENSFHDASGALISVFGGRCFAGLTNVVSYLKSGVALGTNILTHSITIKGTWK